MFGKSKRKQQEALMSMLSSYRPTSKSSLKLFCLTSTKGNVAQASELYDFMTRDIETLPDFDPVPPTWIDNTKQAVGGIFDFVRENKDGIAQVYDIVRGVLASRGKNLPPIGDTAAEAVAESLPPIN